MQLFTNLLSLNGMRRVISFTDLRVCAFLSASTKLAADYLVDGWSEGQYIWHVGRSALAVHHFGPGVPWSVKIVKVQKQFCNAFLVHRLAERNETLCAACFQRFW